MNINYHRFGLYLIVFIHPIWGYVTKYTLDEYNDPLIYRYLISGMALSAIIFTHIFKKNLDKVMLYTNFIVLSLTAHLFWQIYANHYNLYHFGGIFLVVAAVLMYIVDLRFLKIYSLFVVCACLYLVYLNSDNKLVCMGLLQLINLSIFSYYFSHKRILSYIELEMQKNQIQSLSNAAAQAAHDIRSPLSALGTLSIGLVDQSGKQKVIIDSIHRIQYIAETLVSQYRASLTKRKYSSSEYIEFDSIVKALVLEKQLQYNHVDISFVTKGNSFKLDLDISREVERIISNLIQNSIEATVEKGKIDVSLAAEDSYFVISILDNGKGIPPEYLQKIFERGFSLNKSKGTGLGLAHAKEYIESINGKIDLTSKVGKGTLVALRIPYE